MGLNVYNILHEGTFEGDAISSRTIGLKSQNFDDVDKILVGNNGMATNLIKYVDYASDGGHPGLKTNNNTAKMLFEDFCKLGIL